MAHAEKHILTQLCHIYGLVALVDDVRISFSKASVHHIISIDSFVQHLNSLLRCCIFELDHLLRQEVLQKLVLVAYLEKFGASTLVVIAEDLELGQALFAFSARPISDVFVRTVAAHISVRPALKDLCVTSETV